MIRHDNNFESLNSVGLLSKSFNNPKCSDISVAIMLEINPFLKLRNYSELKLTKILQFGFLSIYIVKAAWCYSKTLLSWYLMARSERLLISYRLVLPVWPTSWQRLEIMSTNLWNSSNKWEYLLFYNTNII